ncbi:MAG: hypothetical protein DRP27_04605 [Thermotogae bacterium]|nr:hypothetical protein [Thermotogota bacterium]RKX45264.1 MAG: hypothetical protein DRP27_04605 [Thermotogota bacterium]
MGWNLTNLMLSSLWFLAGVLKIAGIGTTSDIPFGIVFVVIGAIFFWGVLEDPTDHPKRLAHTYVGGVISIWLAILSVAHTLLKDSSYTNVYFELGVPILAVLSYFAGLRARKEIEAGR